MLPELLPPRRSAALVLGLAAVLAGCQTPATVRHGSPAAMPPPVASSSAPAPTAKPSPAAPLASTPAPVAGATPAVAAVVPLPPLAPPAADDRDGLRPLLAYADRVRALTPAELATEIAALGDPGASAPRQMQLAIALSQTHAAVDTARAVGLLQRVAASPAPDAAPLQPLARLLAHRLAEQRRLEDTAERQAQQLRDSQRRIEQLTERLDAVRAIERSLNNRSAPRATTP